MALLPFLFFQFAVFFDLRIETSEYLILSFILGGFLLAIVLGSLHLLNRYIGCLILLGEQILDFIIQFTLHFLLDPRLQFTLLLLFCFDHFLEF